MGKTILITGAAGMIGSNLVHYLLKNTDYRIIGVDDLSGGFVENLPSNKKFTIHYGPICDSMYIERVFKHHKPDIVYHAAAYAAEGLSPFIRTFNYTNNLVGTANIVNCCINHDVKKLVFFSSIAVYGHERRDSFGRADTFKEWHTPKPIDPYGIAKYACEMDIRVAGEQHGLDYVIVRPFNVYGERQNIWDKYRNVLGIWMYNYLNNKPIQIYGDGEQLRCFTYVQDIMEPLLRLGLGTEAQFSREIFNIGTYVLYSLNELAEIFNLVVGDCKIEYLPARHEVKKAVCSVDKFSSILKPKFTTLPEGIRKMWEWVKNQPKRESLPNPSYEITKGMYDHWKK